MAAAPGYGWSTQRIERWTIAAISRLLLSE
jgi:hypothetical protein